MTARPDGPKTGSAEAELAKERTFGGEGQQIQREIRRIDIGHFDRRFEEIANQIWDAAVDIIQGPDRRYEPITAGDYLQQRIAANFAG